MESLGKKKFDRLVYELQWNDKFKREYGYGNVKDALKQYLAAKGVKAMQAEENYYDLGMSPCV